MKKKIRFSIRPVLGILMLVVSLVPIYWMISISLRSTEEMRGEVPFFPQSFTVSHYIELFQEQGFGQALINSTITTLVSLAISLVFGITCAYILARVRFRLKGRKILVYWVLLVRVMPLVSFAIPFYIMFTELGILATLIPVIAACVFINIPLTIWFIISFFRDLPTELEESAKLDGATEWKLFVRIVLPLVLPGIAAVAMLSFVYAWNEYTYSVMFVQTPQHYTVPLKLATINMDDNVMQYGSVAAGGVISIAPMAIFVIFAQKYLISGLSSGAVKE